MTRTKKASGRRARARREGHVTVDKKTTRRGKAEFDERLSRYMDGELDPQSAAMLEAELEADDALASEFEAYLETRAALIEHSERDLARVDFTGFWDRIDEAIADEAQRRQEKAARVQRGGWWIPLIEWFRSRPLLPLGATLATAALVLLVVRDPTSPSVRRADGDGLEMARRPDTSRPAPTVQDESPQADDEQLAELGEVLTEGVQVTSLNAEYGSVMVLQAPDNALFIWVDDGEETGSSAI